MSTDFPAAVVFSAPCDFIAGAGTVASLPPFTAPEIAFIGRSNVGKSSLVNALVGRNALARVSANPGMTKQLNFYELGRHLILVDMPGYGYAKVSKTKKSEWDELIRSYLLGRPTLKRACLLIDARRGIMEKDDEFMTMLDDSAVNYQVVLTKIDALTAGDLGVLLESVKRTVAGHVAAHPHIIATSSLRKEGIHELQEQLLPFAIA
jgi:GTP-binding protein